MNINLPTILDVAIGLIFIFFVFSLFVSGIVELINSIFEQRAKLLRKALNKLLGRLVADDFFSHKLTSNKQDNFWGFHKPINYLSANSFSTVLIDLLANTNLPAPTQAAASVTANPNTPKLTQLKQTEQTFQEIRKILQGADPKYQEIRELIRPILAKSNNFHMFQHELETWYNGYMEQVSGWFKRYAQGVVWAVSAIVALALNVDTIYLTDRLFNDNGLRERLVAAAIKTTQDKGESFGKDKDFVDYLHEHGSRLIKSDTVGRKVIFSIKPNLTSADSLVMQTDYVRFVQNEIADLKLPIGWEWRNKSPHPQTAQNGWYAVFGWVLTAAALSFGAPFWFDLLLKLVNIRNTARRPPGNPEPAK